MPIYNEGDKVIKLLNLFHASVKTQFRLLLCYDYDDDNIFDYKNDLKKYSFDTMLVKNSSNEK